MSSLEVSIATGASEVANGWPGGGPPRSFGPFQVYFSAERAGSHATAGLTLLKPSGTIPEISCS